MQPEAQRKTSLFNGMFETSFTTKFSAFDYVQNAGAGERSIRSGNSSAGIGSGKKKKSVLTSIKKIVKLQGSSQGVNADPFIPSSDFLSKELQQRHNDYRPVNHNHSRDHKLEWWDPPQDTLPVEFCQDTSLHGLKYIGQSKRHISERIFWCLMFIIGLSVAIWLISEMWTKYKMNPVIVSFQPFETNVDQIPFPAITVCNMNKVMKSKAEEFISLADTGNHQAQKDVYYMDHVCLSTQTFAKRFNFTGNQKGIEDSQRQRYMFNETAQKENLTRVNEFLRKAAQNCTDMIRLCVWDDQEVNCSTLFKPIETDFGKCCTFNMIPLSLMYTLSNDSRDDPEEIKQWGKWDIDDNDGLLLSSSPEVQKFPRRQMKAGQTNGLSILLDVKANEYYCTSSDSYGFRMVPHLPLELPKVGDFGFALRPKTETFVDVYPFLTMVDPDIFSFSLDKRNCYKTEELKLRYFKHYSVNNCIDECVANETIKQCECKRYYMPRDPNEPLCGPQKFECAEQVRYNKTKNGIRNTCSMCLQSCTEVSYEPQISSAPLREGIWKSLNGSNPDWKENDLSIVHVYIGEDSLYAKVRKELYGPTDLFANTGGLMGLCLGFSGLSLVELCYFLTIRAWWKHKRKQVVVPEQNFPKWIAEDATETPTPTSKTPTPGNAAHPSERKRTRVQNGRTSYLRTIFGELR